MDFNFTPDQLALRKMVQEVVAKEIVPRALEMDHKGEIDPDLLGKLDDAGLLNLPVPEEYDGPGLDAISIGMIYEEMGKGCAGIATTVAANALASYPVILAGTEEQKRKFFEVINSGKMAAFALTEPGAGSDAGAVATTAVKDGDDYILNGTKCFITNGGIGRNIRYFCQCAQIGWYPRTDRLYSRTQHSWFFHRQRRRQDGHKGFQYL